jgi:hypothetical protein
MKYRLIIVAAALAGSLLGCSSELTDNGSPVELVVTNTQNLQRIDIRTGATGCDASVGTINMLVLPKNTSVTGNFVQVRVTRYRVSYQRTDGGTQVPASFVRSIDTLLTLGESTALAEFVILQGDAITQSPFAALLPANGGRDPETGRPLVKMDVIVELFGETLGGDNVYDATRFPLDFCFNCGGCA